jgi:hypothetical protein
MSLDLPQLLQQVREMGRSISQRLSKQNQLLPQLLQDLEAASNADRKSLQQKIERAGKSWPGAIPTQERMDVSYPPPHPLQTYTVLASDGSQIHPDRHAAALYYLINTGSIRIRYGSGAAPETSSTSTIFYEEKDIFDEYGGEISASIVNAHRDVAELKALSQLAEHCDSESTLALMDNGLLLWLAAQSGERRDRQVNSILQQYLQQLTRFQKTGAAIAGFIDRPRHANVIALLRLASLGLEEINEDLLRVNPYLGISDCALFGRILQYRERSALYVQNASLNFEFKERGHEVHFFYVNTGEMARVEVPHWVAHSPELLSLVHAGIIEQCKLTNGYPYALVRAHELAVVTNMDRQSLDAMIQNSLMDHGWMAQQSLKSETKRWTGRRRRHRL